MPGISVMAEKYMIRLDDNSVELAHDVLTPLIKDEREKKRKVAAQIIATRRARRKAAIWTATGILLAILTYYFTTCKAYQDKAQAFKDKDKAIEDTKQIQTQRDAVKSEFNSVKDSLDRLRKQKIDSPFRGNGELNQFDSARHIKDSLQNNVLINELKQEREKANAFRLEMANVSAQMGILSAQNKKLAGDNNKLQTENAYLNRQYAFYKSQLERSQNRVKALSDSLGAIFIERPVPIPVPPDPIPDANSFILDFKYKGLFKDFDKLGIFMIPYTRDNLKLIRENKEFDIACDPSKISKAPGVKKALFSTKAGQYFFNNVRDGKYLIKFCTLYGNYETVVVKKGLKGSKTIMVAPPIPK